ncbi:NadS family protein [Acidiferrobacter thiooxydans]|jgi:putative transcriptional regulator|uniref:Transcriptional regulator n=1 Tax=Acidiferrobacter thiooxydans TaxID=163359 RepID=A0A368HFE9_9GAMM|nr:NadS family protein [Acidiferrobacter thiooxydans]MDA8120694.1 NadS family protein [Gammaproteobacteria bacterium]RCN55767.1 transcriptional regulator [Acidiferrobacter thiooxydans]
MDKTLFNDLLQSLQEAGAIARGTTTPSRRIEVVVPDVRAVRERVHLSQQDFATLIQVSVKTLQNWEQGRRHPTGPAAALLKIVASNPEMAMKSLHS